jgi:two-component system phosphate regulon sensor histidine kinase PhoR
VAERALPALENHASRPEVATALASGRGASIRYSTTLRQRMMYVAVPFERGEATGVARVAMPLTAVDDAIAEVRRSVLLASFLALVFAVVLASVAVQLTSKTLRRLTAAARGMAGGDLAVRTRIPGDDEIAALGSALDRLAENLSATLGRLKAERDLLEAVLSGMQEGILVVDAEGRILLLNPALEAMLSLEGDSRGRTVLQVVRHAELTAVLEGARGSPLASGEIEVAGPAPQRRRLLVKAIRLAGMEGGVLAVFVDVTDLRRLESIRREFVANASHELRTPVTAVRVAAETLRSAIADPDTASRFIRIIERSAERLQQLIDDLLELSRIESREYALDVEPLALAPLVQAAITRYSERAAQRGIAIEMTRGVEGVAVHADRRALDIVLGNLLDNAVKYCSDRARVAVGATRDGERVRISVSDSGPGIEPRHLSRIFERFYRVDAGRSRELGGTGLGLAIVKHLIEAMGGTVGVESTVGAGTTFTFSLPAAPAATPAVQQAA